MSPGPDVIILGAGPAGMAAATRLRDCGVAVTLIDEQPALGGQIWRGIETSHNGPLENALGKDYRAGAGPAAVLRASGAELRLAAQVWQIEEGWRVFVKTGDAVGMVTAPILLLASGAQERPNPFPGWTLPGVVSVGGAQIMLKTSGQVPENPVWVAGSGPLPLLYMTQLLALGGRLAGYLDTAPRENFSKALPHFPAALTGWRDLYKGARWLWQLRRTGIPVISDVAEIEAKGNDRLETIAYRRRGGEWISMPAEVLLAHEGVVPGVHFTLALGCEHDWRDDQLCFAPRLDDWGETSREGLFVAGDGAGIGGAEAARLRGEITAIGIARRLGKSSESEAARLAKSPRRELARALATRPFLDALYRPRPEIFVPAAETVVCRCEEVTAKQILDAARLGGSGPNQVKAFTRAGMGPCQGRQCGYTVSHLLARQQDKSVGDVGFFHIRPPLKPVSLGDLAALHVEESAL
ncbi:FAD-dependent oxidoreductase [Pelagibius litoralis]|uniref:FAD-dependent oxidoreductase n=1 Tax=Pelagibius litoralis TaxID=374515 RepID=A0A967F1H2_9PROT|nr:NAD(P)/FAD-dependent oxidoreductase [Pelagibius litoralis]NIA71411.1 FAD-dependent oxidoreductase [Pelagibius litoralis]